MSQTQSLSRIMPLFNEGQSLLALQSVQEVNIYSYSFPFKQPLHLGRQILSNREGWVIEITDRDGFSGMGEIAPLPGYSIEAPELVSTQIRRLSRQFSQHDPFELSALHYEIKSNGLLPSVAFGIETALHHLFNNRLRGGEREEQKNRRAEEKKKIPVNALLIPDVFRVSEQLKELLKRGFETIKLKVGRQEVEDDIKMVNRITSMLPPGIRLRLDANGLWTYREALAFGRGIESSGIEYIEEPFTHTEQIPSFYDKTGIPCAMDESLHIIDLNRPEVPSGVKGFVLKPTITGGLGRTLALIDLAEDLDIKPVISSCFECGPGFSILMEIAAAIDFDDSASGLDTLKYLEQDLFSHPIEIHDGAISLDTLHRLDSPGIYNMQALSLL
jgi:o-succinylbenzoate synthase